MADVTLAMIYELALEVRDLQADLIVSASQTLEEARALNRQATSIRRETQGILTLAAREDARLGRIERRLGLA